MGQGFFESDKAYQERVAREANERSIEESTGRAPSQGFFESNKDYENRISKEANEHIVEDSSGHSPSQGWFESDRDYSQRISQEANERIISDSTGQRPSQGWFESDASYETRVRAEANESLIERYGGQSPKQGIFENDHDYRSRISREARELLAGSDHTGGKGWDGDNSSSVGVGSSIGGGVGGAFGGLLAAAWFVWIAPAVLLGLLLLVICPALWLVWRLFRRKPEQPNNDFVGSGWTILGTLLATYGIATLASVFILFAANWRLTLVQILNTSHVSYQESLVYSFWFIILLSWPASGLVGGLDLLRKNRAVVALLIVIALSAAVIYRMYVIGDFNAALAQIRAGSVHNPLTVKMQGHTSGLTNDPRRKTHGAESSAVPQGINPNKKIGQTAANLENEFSQNPPCNSTPVSDQSAMPVVSPDVADSLLLDEQKPIYPAIAQIDKVSGTVRLEASISQAGNVTNVHVISGPAMLQKSAMEAVRARLYHPYIVCGVPVAFKTTVDVVFGNGNSTPGFDSSALQLVSPDVANSLLIYKQTPTYPPIAQIARISGTVKVEAEISQTGTVADVHAISGPAMLSPSALEAVKKWRYRPYIVGGVPVAFKTIIEIKYSTGNSSQ